MAAPKPSTVVLLLAVFACVALYVLGLGLGATDRARPGRPSMSQQERQRLRERFIRPRPVQAEALSADCPLSDGVLSVQAGSTCRVEIAEAGGRLRTLEVAPEEPGSLALRFTPRGRPALPRSEERLREPVQLDVSGEGAELALTCRGAPSGGAQPGRCRARLR